MNERVHHGQAHVGVAGDAPPIAERLRQRPPQDDAHVLHSVVAVDVEVSLAANAQIHQPVAGDLGEHVVEKTDACIDFGLARAV